MTKEAFISISSKVDWKTIIAQGALVVLILGGAAYNGIQFSKFDYLTTLFVVSTAILFTIAVLSRFGSAGRALLKHLFLLELVVPFGLVGLLVASPQGALAGIFALFAILGVTVSAIYVFFKFEERFQKFNLRFIAIILIVFAFAFFVRAPLMNLLGSVGNTWPDTFYVAFRSMDLVRDNPIIFFLMFLFPLYIISKVSEL